MFVGFVDGTIITMLILIVTFPIYINELQKGKELIRNYNPHIPILDAISGALITLSLSILKPNSECEGARGKGYLERHKSREY